MIPTAGAPRLALVACLAAALGACAALPRVGPNKQEIFEGSVLRSGDAFVVTVNSRVTQATAVTPALGFADGFLSAARVGADTIAPGDVLSFTVYENVEEGLLSGTSAGAATISELQVDGAGMVFVPYAGRLRAAGNTPAALQRLVTERLDEQTPDPQVIVRRIAGDGATVSVLGAVGGQGVYPIERPTRTLLNMIAAAGGVAVSPDIARVTLRRGGHIGEVWFSDLYEDPRTDIALRPDDDIIVEADNRSFTALGATGAQSVVEFDRRTISALEALALVGGLAPTRADPTGVFVMRHEPQEIAEQVLARDDLIGTQRMVYLLDLTEPNGLFEAKEFAIRDGDLVYVTEAPYAQFARVITAITATTTTAAGLESTLSGN